jgi:hypothetical protein
MATIALRPVEILTANRRDFTRFILGSSRHLEASRGSRTKRYVEVFRRDQFVANDKPGDQLAARARSMA